MCTVQILHIRWVTPVKEFMRTAVEDTTIRGDADQCGGIGAAVLPVRLPRRGCVRPTLPLRRRPRPQQHVAFGYGVHFCLGAALARMEVNSFFSALMPRLRSIELDRATRAHATIFVGGLKHLPIRYSLK